MATIPHPLPLLHSEIPRTIVGAVLKHLIHVCFSDLLIPLPLLGLKVFPSHWPLTSRGGWVVGAYLIEPLSLCLLLPGRVIGRRVVRIVLLRVLPKPRVGLLLRVLYGADKLWVVLRPIPIEVDSDSSAPEDGDPDAPAQSSAKCALVTTSWTPSAWCITPHAPPNGAYTRTDTIVTGLT